MRLIAFMLSLFLFANVTQTFSAEHVLRADTVNHVVKKPYRKHIPNLRDVARHKDYFDDCVFVNKYTTDQRLKKYPYSEAVKVLAVSYHCWVMTSPYTNKKNVKKADSTGLHIHNGRLDYSTLIEIKRLTQNQIDRLTNIIYNTDYKVHDTNALNSADLGGCFSPRNALIFFDKNGKVFDSIQICFECSSSRSQSDRITIGTACTQKYDLLKKYFISLGIKYGTINK